MLALKNIRRAFNRQTVLDDVSLNVAQGEIMCLLGASGSGKTTLLRIIAGLETADSGELLLHDQSFTQTPVHQRDFGLMFQDFALFPHMDVAENILFGMKMQRVSSGQKRKRLSEVLELVGLSGFEKRDVSQLSGGERQRVALARSLAPRPRLLMLDEPLGSLDAALRDRLVVELREIIKSVGLTAIYVTHDQHEAFAIADRIAIMHAGKINQVGTPSTLYYQPRTRYIAEFLGLRNIIPVHNYQNGHAYTGIGEFAVSKKCNLLLLHPDGLHLEDKTGIHVRVREQVFQGASYRLSVEHESGTMLTLRLPAFPDPVPTVGDDVFVCIEPWAVIPLDVAYAD